MKVRDCRAHVSSLFLTIILGSSFGNEVQAGHELAASNAYKAEDPQLFQGHRTIRHSLWIEAATHEMNEEWSLLVETANKWRIMRSNDVEPYHYLGVAFRELGQIEASISAFEVIHRKYPSDDFILFNMALSYSLGGAYEKAQELLIKALDVNSEYADALSLLNFVQEEAARIKGQS